MQKLTDVKVKERHVLLKHCEIKSLRIAVKRFPEPWGSGGEKYYKDHSKNYHSSKSKTQGTKKFRPKKQWLEVISLSPIGKNVKYFMKQRISQVQRQARVFSDEKGHLFSSKSVIVLLKAQLFTYRNGSFWLSCDPDRYKSKSKNVTKKQPLKITYIPL